MAAPVGHGTAQLLVESSLIPDSNILEYGVYYIFLNLHQRSDIFADQQSMDVFSQNEF